MFSFVGNLKLFIMEAKELRIGNILLCAEREIPYRVTAEDILVIDDGSSKSRPVPLTEEILLKCGFIKRWNAPAMLINYGELQSVFTINIVKNEFYFTYGDLQVKYLHQLQNLYFALTNEELTVNL